MEYCRDTQEHDNTGIELCGVYRDLPIEIDEFRVLSVQPASSRDSLVITDLYVEKFKDRQGNYDALSYTWGDLSSTEVIVVNGTETSVTRNLRLALQNLRHRSQDQNEPARLWVDSICINQANTTERNIQVAQMGKIYSQARHVAIWLGDASETSHVAMQLLNDCDGLSGDIDIIGRVIGDEAGGRALTELLRRRYWSRIWVFQEIVLSRSVTVYCGNLSAKWDVFRRLDWISGRPSLWTGLGIRSGWVLALRRAFFGIAQFCIPREDAVDMNNVL
ncbi:hypothetical protein CGMCC3_g433 [Colletotrichum fructicola]|nr:uncharacterized protein CGMCC3_g433 [Colletotrichum fructicola]KAE9583540.1 hypothetical protein CGMCC3_g433 [Colletotrichum fructicola]KAF4427872.1 Heterokaryon incompatibility protein 6 [Colletotrichum fructicola]KAF4883243.1 Heterokaryon incompatibility protein 6, OR allele [Colletotrichum fructicola]